MWQISSVRALNCLGGMDISNPVESTGKRLKRGLNRLFGCRKETDVPLSLLINVN
jgi:hypothetical protein